MTVANKTILISIGISTLSLTQQRWGVGCCDVINHDGDAQAMYNSNQKIYLCNSLPLIPTNILMHKRLNLTYVSMQSLGSLIMYILIYSSDFSEFNHTVASPLGSSST